MSSDPSSPENKIFNELRELLLAREQERIDELEQSIKDLNLGNEQLKKLFEDIKSRHEDTDALAERIKHFMPGMVSHAIRNSGDEMAEILGPVMGDAIRVQIRDSRDEMVDTLHPIIGATIQKAINQFAREFQRNIDHRLQSTFGPEGMMRRIWARFRGVRVAELALRDAFPFHVKQVFLIHRESGILIAQNELDSEDNNLDIISGMLTAIRSFASDAFHSNDELDEIQFGDDHIILRNGAYAYLAVVISGVEPEGFRSRLGEFVSDLHLRNNNLLRDFKGDSRGLSNLQPQLQQLADVLNGDQSQAPATHQQNRLYTVVGLAGFLFVLLACFYFIFTIRLLPVAFPKSTATATLTPTFTPTLTATPTYTPTSSPTPTATFSPTPQPDNEFDGVSIGAVWVRIQPDESSEVIGLLIQNTPIQLHNTQDTWSEISWTDENGEHRGWIPSRWIRVE